MEMEMEMEMEVEVNMEMKMKMILICPVIEHHNTHYASVDTINRDNERSQP
jgi:hypothetical protein